MTKEGDMRRFKVGENVLAVYFTALATVMHCFQEESVNIGQLISVKHLIGLIIVFSGIVCFLVKPNIPRAFVAAKGSLVICVTVLVSILASFIGWLASHSGTEIIKRGIIANFWFMNPVTAAFVAAVFLYLFGEKKGFYCYLISIITANIILISKVIITAGAYAFFSELWELIITFADDTGSVIVQAEFHEIAFCLGTFLTFMFIFPRKNKFFWILLGVGSFLFLIAFKRIGILAIGISVLLGWILRYCEKKKTDKSKRVINFSVAVILIILVAYIFLIERELFPYLEEHGINTSGRDKIYALIAEYYVFSPRYIGRGMGFVNYTMNSIKDAPVVSIHNDFLNNYVELGFWGYLLWLGALLPLRTKYFGKIGFKAGIAAFCITVYFTIASMTDNTMIYQNVLASIAMCTMVQGFDERVESETQKLIAKGSL